MVKFCSPPGERAKRSILVQILLNKKPSLVAGQSQQLLAGTGILRNPEDSGVNTGISVPQEFLRKIPVKTEKQEFLRPLQNQVPMKNSSGKRRKKISSGILAGTVFWVQKINS